MVAGNSAISSFQITISIRFDWNYVFTNILYIFTWKLFFQKNPSLQTQFFCFFRKCISFGSVPLSSFSIFVHGLGHVLLLGFAKKGKLVKQLFAKTQLIRRPIYRREGLLSSFSRNRE